MQEPKNAQEDREGSLFHVGRRIVELSAELPREALDFLRSPTLVRQRGPAPGAAPGEMSVGPNAQPPTVRIMAYGSDELDERDVEGAEELRDALARSDALTWIDVHGLGDEAILRQIGEVLEIHPLAMADVVHVPQRPKAELYEDRLVVIAQVASIAEGGVLDIEQVSLVLGPSWVVTFQERPGDVFDPVRMRLRSPGTRIRQMKPEYLLYSLLDAVIDAYFPIVEAIAGVFDALEEEVISGASHATLTKIHATRRTLMTLHRVQWRQRDALSMLLRSDGEFPITDAVKPYLRDAHDHAFQTLDALETYREMFGGLMDLHQSSISNRTNEVMRTLTVVATIFIPLTFVTGVYGMNFERMPELSWAWAYPALWIGMVAIAGGLMLLFRRRGWLGDENDPRR